MIVKGKIKDILTQKENDWGRFKVKTEKETILAVGIIPMASIGMAVELEGDDITNQYGRQFKISSVLDSKTVECAGVQRFISEYLKGFGPVSAKAIVEKFGDKTLDMFESEKGLEQLKSVKRVTNAILEKAVPSYIENKKFKDIVVFLNGMGTKHQISLIHEKYGENAIKILKSNPYRLQMDLDGFGFIKVDKIAIASGVKPDSLYRVMAAIKFVIEEAQTSNGHCYLSIDEITKGIIPLLAGVPTFKDISDKVAENALANPHDWQNAKEKLIKAHNPSAETLNTLTQIAETRAMISDMISDAILQAIDEGFLTNDDGRIYTTAMYKRETSAAQTVAELCLSHPVRYVQKETIEKCIKATEERKTAELKEKGRHEQFIVSNEQRNAVYLGLMNRFSIISGGPGRGKTTIIEAIINSFLESGKKRDINDVLILAPTGRAAQRVTESTGFPSSTVHRAIYKVSGENGFSFRLVDENERPKGKLIICDESSMVDIRLAADLFTYAKECNIILVGDVDQIASVGPGKVLKDLIDSSVVPCAMLKEGHRNEGSIAHNAPLINAGMKINNYCYDSQFVYIPSTAEHIADDIVKDYVKMVEKYGIKNVMLCTAMRERGPVAVNKLNTLLQNIFTSGNDEAKYSETKVFRVGDRVMQTANNYRFILKSADGTLRQGLFNGERGTVQKIIYDATDESFNMTVLFDDGSLGGYTRETAGELTLAYATTLHKCQGSEADCMMMAYTYGDFMLLNKALFYTGETRAKKEFRFYGEEQLRYGKMLSAFDIAVSKSGDVQRHTLLSMRVQYLVERGK